jgi:hypothetical protein
MSSRAELYKKLLKQVARELGEKTTADIVKHVATIKLMRENIQIRLLAGERVDPADVVKIDECLKRYLPAGKPISVQIEVLPRLNPEPDQPSPSTPPDGGGNPVPAETSPAPLPDNVVPLKRTAEQECALQEERCAPPIKRGNEPWRGHIQPNLGAGAPGHSDPFGTYGPIPDFSASYRGR